MRNNMPRLIFTQPEFTDQSCELPEGRTVVGRSSRSDLVIRDESVSADHCEILVSWNEVIVREHSSKNGTWIAERRVTGQLPVNHGQTIRFGRVEARVEIPQAALEDTTVNTTHMLRQQAGWSEPACEPFHAVVQPDANRPAGETTDGGTITVPAPVPAELPPAPSAVLTGAKTARAPNRGALIGWIVMLVAAGVVLTGVWLLRGGT